MCISIQSRSRHYHGFLVVSDRDDHAKGWKSLFENPAVFEVHQLYEVFVHPEPSTNNARMFARHAILPASSAIPLSFFLSWVANIQLNHWTKRVVTPD